MRNRYAIQICNKEPSMSNQPPLDLSNQSLPPLNCPISQYTYATKLCNTAMQYCREGSAKNSKL